MEMILRIPPKTITVVGIDPSTSNTGLVALRGSKKTVDLVEDCSVKLPSSLAKNGTRFEKQRFMLEGIEGFMSRHPDAVLVGIEDYGINMRRPGSIIPLCELGGVIRFYLHSAQHPYIQPKPTQIKQFTTGKGKGDKQPMIKAVAKRWGYAPLLPNGKPDDNRIDAFACAVMALAFKGSLPNLTNEQRTVIGQLSLN